jgi:hypothetical protein
VHFTSDGWLTPVVNPLSFGQEGQNSPEGQAFVLELQAAYRDWVNNGSQGKNGAVRLGMMWASVGPLWMGLFTAIAIICL